jgi:hypothetical protein
MILLSMFVLSVTNLKFILAVKSLAKIKFNISTLIIQIFLFGTKICKYSHHFP